MHPGSGSPTKNWHGFAEIVRLWRRRRDAAVLVMLGPAESGGNAADTIEGIDIEGIPLPKVAALLEACDLYLGNDSGISHLAAAVNARGVVLFGPTDPRNWAPRSARLRIIHAPQACAACGPAIFCVHRLPVESVMHAIERQRRVSGISTGVAARQRGPGVGRR